MYKVKVYNCKKFGTYKNIFIEYRDRDKLLKNQLRVKILTIGLNYVDILMIKGKYQYKLNPPFVPGIEACGIIIEERCNKKNLLNKKVIINRKGGCFSEEIVVNLNEIIIVPTIVNSILAGGYFIPYLTSYIALKEVGEISKGDKVLVTGASGGVGSAFMNSLKSLGAKIFPITTSPKKKRYIYNLVSNTAIVHNKNHPLNLFKYKGKMDVVIDINGFLKSENILSTLKWGGKYIIIGFMENNVSKIKTNYILIKGLKVFGIRAGEYLKRQDLISKSDILGKVLKNLIKNKVPKMIFNVISFDDLKEGLKEMSERNSIGKIIVKTRHYDE